MAPRWTAPDRLAFGMTNRRRLISRSLICWAAFLCWSLTEPAWAAEEIKVPFNFAWGEAAQRLEDSLKRVQARVVDRKKVRNRAVSRRGRYSPAALAARLVLLRQRFAQRNRAPLWRLLTGTPTVTASFFDQTRRNIETKYGIGRVVARQKTRDGDILRNTHWLPMDARYDHARPLLLYCG